VFHANIQHKTVTSWPVDVWSKAVLAKTMHLNLIWTLTPERWWKQIGTIGGSGF
jgi:hypothetical protein